MKLSASLSDQVNSIILSWPLIRSVVDDYLLIAGDLWTLHLHLILLNKHNIIYMYETLIFVMTNRQVH